MNRRREICASFNFIGEFVSAEPYGGGHTHDTFKVICHSGNDENTYILQRINKNFFKNPSQLMDNIGKVTEHMRKNPSIQGFSSLSLVRTKSGKLFLEDGGEYYRAYQYIPHTVSYDYCKDLDVIYEAGRAFGDFQKMLIHFPAELLHETVTDLHNLSKTYQDFCNSFSRDACFRKEGCLPEIKYSLENSSLATMLQEELEKGTIPVRVIHNDIKISNVLFDLSTHQARCVIDLDLVMPGSLIYDFGDAVRQFSGTATEDEENLDKVWWDENRYRAFCKGYLTVMGKELTENEKKFLPFAGILGAFEAGLRYLTDYFNCDLKYKVDHAEHNLYRGRNQFKMVEDMRRNLQKIQAILAESLGE